METHGAMIKKRRRLLFREQVVIENGITEVGVGAFNDFTFLKTIVLADSVRKIGDAAFEDCWMLESCRFSNNISIIAQYAFSGCGLRSIKLPSSVTYIGKSCWHSSPDRSK